MCTYAVYVIYLFINNVLFSFSLVFCDICDIDFLYTSVFLDLLFFVCFGGFCFFFLVWTCHLHFVKLGICFDPWGNVLQFIWMHLWCFQVPEMHTTSWLQWMFIDNNPTPPSGCTISVTGTFDVEKHQENLFPLSRERSMNLLTCELVVS